MRVQIDEFLFSEKKHNVGRSIGKSWIVGGICLNNNDVSVLKLSKFYKNFQ